MNDTSQASASQADDQNQAQTQTGGQNDEYLALKSELEQTQTKLQEMVIISQRALADLQNFRRRSEEEKAAFIQYANADFTLELLPVIDNIHRALAHEPKDAEWIKGVEQTFRQFTQILEKKNIKTIATAGQIFDPNLHEALLMGPGEKDIIVEELEKGYLLGEKVLKRARVKVGDGNSA